MLNENKIVPAEQQIDETDIYFQQLKEQWAWNDDVDDDGQFSQINLLWNEKYK